MDRHAQAAVTPVRQRTQYSCMSASMMMCLNALGHTLTEDQVNQVLGAEPMRGASWEQMLACTQYFGCRATLTTPSTVTQLKEWTDAGVPVVIAWNPEGRPWSHASVVFHVDDARNVHIADPNIPNPEKTVRIVSEDEFYGKWFEKFGDYLVRRPACAITREITPTGKVIQASRRNTMLKATDYDPLPGMEGPFNYNGRILYFDRNYKGGSYYDRGMDIYLDHDEAVRIMNRRASSSRVDHWIKLYGKNGVTFSPLAREGLRHISSGVTPQDGTIKGALEVWMEDLIGITGEPPTRKSSPEVFALADEMGFHMPEIARRIEAMHARGEYLDSKYAATRNASSSQNLYDKWSAELTQKRIRITPLIQRGLEAMSYFGEKEGVLQPKDAIESWVDTMVRTSQEISRQKHSGIYALANALGVDIDLEVEDAESFGKTATDKKPKPQVVQAPKQRDPNAEAMAVKRNRGDGAHQNRTHDVGRGRSRTEKHRTDWREKEASEAVLTQRRGQFTINQAFLDLLLTKYSGTMVRDQYSVSAGRYTLLISPTGNGDYTIEGAPAEVLLKAAEYLRAQFIQKL